MPAAKEEEEEEGRRGTAFALPYRNASPHLLSWLTLLPSEMLQTLTGAAQASIPAPNWERRTRLPREEGSSWGCSMALLPHRFTSGQAAAQRWELAD